MSPPHRLPVSREKQGDRDRRPEDSRRSSEAAHAGPGAGAEPQLNASFDFPLHRSRRIRIGLLAIDVPVTKFVERDRLPADGASHECARSQNAKIAVKIFDLGFAHMSGLSLELVHRSDSFLPIFYATVRPGRESAISAPCGPGGSSHFEKAMIELAGGLEGEGLRRLFQGEKE